MKSAIPAGEPRLKLSLKLLDRVLQPQHEQKQKNADFCPKLNEAFAEVQRRQSAIAKCEAGQQVERDGLRNPTQLESWPRIAKPTIEAPSSRRILEASGMDGSITDLVLRVPVPFRIDLGHNSPHSAPLGWP